MLLSCRNSSNTAQNILRNGKCALNFITDEPKYLFEEELKKSGLTYCIHRPTGYFYDIVKVFRPMIEKGEVTLLGNDPVHANVVSTEEFGAFIADHITDQNTMYNVGGKEAILKFSKWTLTEEMVALAVCLVGFYRYVYFLSIGYGFRLSGFLLIREIKNASYRKTLKEATGEESAMPIFVKFAIWICVAALYVAQTSLVFFRVLNCGEVSAFRWAGIVICIVFIAGFLKATYKLLYAANICYLAKKLKKPGIIAIYVVSFFCCLGMGYLSSKDFAEASMNWIAEGINVVGQGCFLWGALALKKAGLEEVSFSK